MKSFFGTALALTLMLSGCSNDNQPPAPQPGGSNPQGKTRVVLTSDELDDLVALSGQSPMDVARQVVLMSMDNNDDLAALNSAIDQNLNVNCNDSACTLERKIGVQ